MSRKLQKARRRIIRRRQSLFDAQGGRCALYTQPLDANNDISIDHITPLSRGGENKTYNMQMVHAKCNNLKGNILQYPLKQNHNMKYQETLDIALGNVLPRRTRKKYLTFKTKSSSGIVFKKN